MSATEHDSGVDAETEITVSDLPPSSKLVYKVLEYEGTMTQEEIVTESRLCSRTVRYALGILKEHDLVASRVSLADARQSKYWIEN